MRFFSLAAGLVLALASCDNLGTGDNADSLAVVQNVTEAGGVLEPRTFSGDVDFQGLLPQEFAGNSSAQENGGRTLFPNLTTTGLTYAVSAACGTKSAAGTVNTSTNKFSIAIPFASTSESWTITLIAKSGSNTVLKSQKNVTYTTTSTSLSMPLNYYKGTSTETGGISLSIPISTSGTTASGIQSATVSWAPSSGSYTIENATLSSSTVSWSKTGLAPGVYNVKVFFYSGTGATGDLIYAISESAMVYSNLTTSVPYGQASYIASGGSGFETITKTLVSNINSLSAGGIWVGGTGPTGTAADDSNNGTKFKPVATLYRAFAIANSLAASDSTKTYTINVQDDIDVGTSANKTATLNSGVKVNVIGTNTASPYKVSGGSSAGTYKISSSGAAVKFQYLNFDKLSVIEVSAGKLTVDDSSVTGGTQGGFLVSAGAELESSQGLTISGCSSAKGGGISCNGTVNLTGAEISGCKSPSGTGSYDGCGGAMFVNGSGAQATLDSCVIGASSASAASSETLCSNYAAKKGGGIYNNGGTVTLKNGSIVQYNYAEANGGGIYNAGTISVSAAAFEQNAAGDLGAAVYYEGAASGKSFTLSGACKFGTTSAAQDIGLANANSGIKLSSLSKASGSGNIILAPNMASGCVIGTPVISSGANTTNIAYFALGDSTKDVCQLSVATGQGVLYLKPPVLNNVSGGTVSENVGNGAFKNAETTPVTVKAIKMARYEVTYELWYAVYQWAVQRDTDPYAFGSCGKEGATASGNNQVISISAPPTTALVNGGEGRGGQRPVTNVSWRDAVVWCNAYSECMGLKPVYYIDADYLTPMRVCDDYDDLQKIPGNLDCPYIKADANGNTDMANCTASGARLPTEAEWEFAARGESQSVAAWSYEYTMYSNMSDLAKVAWYDGNSDSVIHCVGKKDPTIRGIYDMLGNNSEWCHDWGADDKRREKGGNSISVENLTNKLCNVSYQGSSVPHRTGPRTGFRFVQNQ